MKAKVVKDKLVIEVPLSLMEHAFANMPETSLAIKSRSKMGRWFAKNIFDYINGYSDSHAFEDLLDAMAIDALESGEPWIEEQEWNPEKQLSRKL
jgi:hypothetical protein